MRLKLIVESFLCILVTTPRSSVTKKIIDLAKFHVPNFSPFLSVNFCKPGLKMFKSYVACNGRIDCPDGSDETSQLCQNTKCSNSSFRCNYGACIGRHFVCNGAFDCADGSDEQPDLCASAQCRVPFATSSTVYYAGECEGECGGFLTEDGAVLHYICANNSTDTNFLTMKPICRNGFWRPGVPSCTGGSSESSKPETNSASGGGMPAGVRQPAIADRPAAADESGTADQLAGGSKPASSSTKPATTVKPTEADKPPTGGGGALPTGGGGNPPTGDGGKPPTGDESKPPTGDGGNPPTGDGGNPPTGDGGNPPTGDGGNPPTGDGGNPPTEDQTN